MREMIFNRTMDRRMRMCLINKNLQDLKIQNTKWTAELDSNSTTSHRLKWILLFDNPEDLTYYKVCAENIDMRGLEFKIRQ